MIRKPHFQLLIALVLGLTSGILLNQILPGQTALLSVMEPIGQLFLRLIFMTVVPVVFFGLVLGVYQLAGHHGLGATVSKTLMYTLIASSLSVVIGITLVNILKPGAGLNLPAEMMGSSAAVEKNSSQCLGGETINTNFTRIGSEESSHVSNSSS